MKKLIAAIAEDYWLAMYRPGSKERAVEFEEGLGYKVNKKYIKVTKSNGGAVWGFVVNTDDDEMFRKGDILRAAGWNAPARNAARGNILDETFDRVRWTGPEYLN
tara:strand:- start:110 stop:424 length:315 start_codon:yes stop_codon:yes gene_type:complete